LFIDFRKVIIFCPMMKDGVTIMDVSYRTGYALIYRRLSDGTSNGIFQSLSLPIDA